MYKLDYKNNNDYYILYKDNEEFFRINKRKNTLEKVIDYLKNKLEIENLQIV